MPYVGGGRRKKEKGLVDALIDLRDPLGFSLKFGRSGSRWARTTYRQ